MRVLVTAGPTREPLDPVRFLGNRSSGRMGYSIARALLARGHEVILVSGPTSLKPPKGGVLEAVETGRQMLTACRKHWKTCDALFGVAAVADYRPAKVSKRKLKKTENVSKTLELVSNPDILATLARSKGKRLAFGFALESGSGLTEALRKLRDKNLDWIALNGPEAQGSKISSLRVLGADGSDHLLGPANKEALARTLVRTALGSNY